MTPPIAVALSRDLPHSTSIGTRVNGIEYVVWRDASGVAHIWDDRCPHRGMKMSLGFVRGDAIACLYHGWEYATDGQCRKIPAHPDLDVPKTIRIGTHPVAERSGKIWLGFDDVPQWPTHQETNPVRSLYVAAPVRTTDLKTLPDGASAALQPVSDGETMLHICVRDPKLTEAAYRWGLRLRSTLERQTQ
ncbi:MAG: Rieske 2Fe-2S domain-containing protein [Pseudomonadota bacterium]